jgi:heme A synthase
MYHRYVVAAVSVLIIATVVQSLRLPRMRGWAVTLGGLFAAQIAVGALQVLLGLPPLWRALHLAVASGVWASLVGMINLTFAGAQSVLPHRDAGASTIQAASGR